MKEVLVQTDSFDLKDESEAAAKVEVPKKVFTNVARETEPLNILENKNLKKDEVIPKKIFTNVSTETEPINILEDKGLEKIPLEKSATILRKENDMKSLPPVMMDASTEMDPKESPLDNFNNVVAEKPVLLDKNTETETEIHLSDSSDSVQKREFESKLANTLDKLKDAETKNKELTKENEKLKTDHEKEIEDIKSSHAKDLDDIKMSHDAQMKDLSEKHGRDVADLKKVQEEEILNLQEEQDMIKTSTDQKLEVANKKVADLTEELSQIDAITEALEKKLDECDQKITNQEQELAAKDSELATKSNEIKEKEEIIADLEKQLEELLTKPPEPEVDNSAKETGNGIEKLREDYESQIAQMKKDHEAKIETLRKDLSTTPSRDLTARRFTLPTGGTKEDEIHPKFSDLIKGFENKISDSENITKPLKKLGKISEEPIKNVDAGPHELNKDEVVQDYESKIADMKKKFETEKKDMTQKHEDNLKKEKYVVNDLEEKMNEIEKKKNKELSNVIKDYEDKIAEIKKQAQQEKEALEAKLKDLEKTEIEGFRRPTRSLLPTEESVLLSSGRGTKNAPDIIQEYEKKLEELKKQAEKEKKDQKEAYELEAERAKDDFRIALAQLNKAMDDKLAQAKALDESANDDRIKDLTNDYEQKIYDLKLENDRQSAQLQQQIAQRDEELKEKYKDLLKVLKDRKDGEIELLNNTIKNLRKELTDMVLNIFH